jgi:hypothetical protein
VTSDEIGATRDEAAAETLSVGYFTTLQVLFSIFLYSPGLVGFFVALSYFEIGTFFTTASLSAFIIVAVGLYILGLILPFASLFWVMAIKLFMGGDIYKNNVTPGVYPKWSRMHLRLWCIAKLEGIVMLSLTIYRSAPLTAFALRQLGATVGSNLQCAKDALPVRPVGSGFHWRRRRHPDRRLRSNREIGGAIPLRRPHPPRERLQDRDAGRHRRECEGGPRHLDHSVYPDLQRRGLA